MKGIFVHTVYFWLKNPDDQADRASFETSITKFINGSEYVQTKFLGTPAGTPREVVDNSYTYCLVATFNSKEEQDKYQEETVHKVFVKESEHLWNKVQVYDAIKMWWNT